MKPFFRALAAAAALATAGLCYAQDAPPPPAIADVPPDYTPPVHEGSELILARYLNLGASSSILARNAQAFAQAETAAPSAPAPPKSIPVKELPEAVPPAKAQPEAAKPETPKVEYHTHYHITPATAGPAPSYAQPETAVPATQSPTKVRHPSGVRRVAARLGRGLENWGSRTWIAVDSPSYQVTPVVATKYVVANPAAVQQERAALASPQALGR